MQEGVFFCLGLVCDCHCTYVLEVILCAISTSGSLGEVSDLCVFYQVCRWSPPFIPEHPAKVNDSVDLA